MNIHQWYKYHLDLNKTNSNRISKIIDINQSTLNRIENGEIIPTLNSIIDIADYFNVNESDFLMDIGKRSIKRSPNEFSATNDLKYDDLNYFVALLGEKPIKANLVFAELLNQLIEIGNNKLNSKLRKSLFDEQQIMILLGNEDIFGCLLRYPSSISKTNILTTLYSNGIIIQDDFLTYLKIRTTVLGKYPYNSREFQLLKKVNHSEPVKQSIGNIRIDLLLELNDFFSENNEIFSLAWRSAYFEKYLAKNSGMVSHKNNAIFNLILLNRWFSSIEQNDLFMEIFHN